MKCMSCETHIPSEWQAAISQNTCPKCGNDIMSSHVKIVADNLKIVVSDLIALGEEQMDLLLDTFGLCRKGVAPKHPAANADLPQGFKQPDNPMHDFLKRSKAPHLADRQEKLKDIVNRVKSSGDEEIPPEAWDDFEESEPVVTAKEFLAQQDGSQPSPEEVRQISQELGNMKEQQDSDLHPALQKDRMRRLQASRDMAGGGGQGLFKRSD